MLTNEGHRLDRVLVCSPRREYFQVHVEDLKSQNLLQRADPETAEEQHDALKEILRRFGADVLDREELPGHPNSVFTRDASLITPEGYIQLRMGLPARRGEPAWMAKILESLEERCAGKIESPGTLEGGDVILAGRAAFVGLSARTNQSGVEQLSGLLQAMGYEMRILPIMSPYLHIGSLMSAVGPEEILCGRGMFPEGFFTGYDALEVDIRTPISCNVICLKNREVIVASSEMETAEALDKKGHRVHLLDLSEFIKGDGGPTCLILPLERTS